MGVIDIFQDLMFGQMTEERVGKAHEFLQPRKSKEIDDFEHILIQFLIRSELWRRHEAHRLAAWDMGTHRQVSEFLTALVYHYWLMHCDDCFEDRQMEKDGSWDVVWEKWLDEYPLSQIRGAGDGDGQILMVREELEGTEEEILENVGYLGGTGKSDEVYKPARHREEITALFEEQ
ncbi:hypothetical protein BGZ63DRAFT_380019 [Mariannaea sp. PMI_226]|nr:hypothetical protein BGZ63DRAFT_380019 [Mariannaea sp. PMI_226]